MNLSDTIIAPATAVGEGGIAVVRISGPRALDSLKKYFRPTTHNIKFSSQRLYHGTLVDQDEQHIDEIMAVYMSAPHTYTCDDVVEIHCHGSQQVVKSILNLYFDYGLRLADAGEFTYRAFANGRLDLSQAEAVARLIHAKTDSSRKLALSQVEGQLSRCIDDFTERLRKIQILVEAWIDFPEEELPREDLEHIERTVSSVIEEINTLIDTFNSGKVLADGASILLVGRPNAGKSSLLNKLLGEERAIVTDIPGTTRDLLEEGITLAGVPVRLVDTAGLRQSDDPVEMEGVKRAIDKIGHADLVLLLIDGSKEVDDQDIYSYRSCETAPTFVVETKSDLEKIADLSFVTHPLYSISIKTGEGLDELKEAIGEYLLGDYIAANESVMLSEQRHYDSLVSTLKNLQNVLIALCEGQSLEFIAFDIRDSLQYLGQISGETTTDSVLSGIFSQFCIGK
ncbi:tRNA modification GTPase trmE [Malonomonas rubra DSM 5091]|uniref:tRNA modification GTPase MnmE n=1 Tax=Malonomonas rubra DSM 5091 TaxID=1122189 RepID=A0A1M6JUR1_MALRU|nr:tRNA uridine-5-carboxymethylaminomethyl(34) synthesis GTPase MnmE [Malonomonas rubra]SHJ50421.1 tRNA modification GTPase trmE [Malonomonas rubra DSM 5091]